MQEAKRLSSEPVGPNPFKHEPAIETLLEVLTRNQEQKTIANQDRRSIFAGRCAILKASG
jgi:hypothetical protein